LGGLKAVCRSQTPATDMRSVANTPVEVIYSIQQGIPRLQALFRTYFHNSNPHNTRQILDQNMDSFVKVRLDFIIEVV